MDSILCVLTHQSYLKLPNDVKKNKLFFKNLLDNNNEKRLKFL